MLEANHSYCPKCKLHFNGLGCSKCKVLGKACSCTDGTTFLPTKYSYISQPDIQHDPASYDPTQPPSHPLPPSIVGFTGTHPSSSYPWLYCDNCKGEYPTGWRSKMQDGKLWWIQVCIKCHRIHREEQYIGEELRYQR